MIYDRASDSAASVGGGDKHASHFTLPVVDTLYRTGANDNISSNRTQEDRSIPIDGFRLVYVRQARIDEVPYEGIRMLMKMLVPD